MALIKWKDSKDVKFITNYSHTETDQQLSYLRRGNTTRTAMPQVASDYRKGMINVDRNEKCRKLYNSRRTVRRWWLTLFFYIYDVVVINSWRIYVKNNPGLKKKERTVGYNFYF